MFLNMIMSIKEKIININGRSQANKYKKLNFDDYESIYSVNPLYLVLIMQTDLLKKKMKINI